MLNNFCKKEEIPRIFSSTKNRFYVYFTEKPDIREKAFDFWYTSPYIYIYERRKSGSDREPRKGRKGKQELAHLRRMHRVRPTPWIRFPPFVERLTAATGPACYYLIFIHSAHCFWITGCPPLHSSSLIFTRGRPSVIYFGTEIRFANHRATYCASRRKADFIVIFTFTSRALCLGAMCQCTDASLVHTIFFFHQ